MTAPSGESPDGSLAVGLFAARQATTEAQAKAAMSGGVRGAFTGVQNTHRTEVREPHEATRMLAVSAQGSADIAVTTAQAAANEAAAAGEKADIAYENAHYWSVECVVASAEVLLGVNELLLGPVLNVPDGLEARLSDVHFAFIEQPGGCTVDVKRWNASGTAADVIHTEVLGANVTRRNAPSLDIPVFDKERFFYVVTDIVGSVPPTVLQINVSGAFFPEP